MQTGDANVGRNTIGETIGEIVGVNPGEILGEIPSAKIQAK